jgi:hypothetical protein
MAGIQDILTNIRTTGQGVPMGMGGPPPGQPPMGGPPPGRPPMGGPPPGQPPMGRPPMGGGIASMGGGQPPMGPPPMGGGQPPMGGGQPPMGMQEPPMEEPMSIEKDSAALAEAVVGRAQGDIGAAVAILDTAKAMLIQSGQQEDPMMMNRGGPMYRNMGGPLYAQKGMSFGDQLQQGARDYLPGYEFIAEEKMPEGLDIDTLKEMIMSNLRENPVLNSDGAANFTSPMGYNVRTAVSQLGNDVLGRDPSNRDSGRTLSDRDMSGRTMSDRETLSDKARFLKEAYERAAARAAAANSEPGRTLSNKDLSGRTYADSDANLYLQALREARKQ